MTFQSGDIVLRGGRSEVVSEVRHTGGYFTDVGGFVMSAEARSATPLGINTRDGWRVDVKDDGGTEAIEVCYGPGRFERKKKGVAKTYFANNGVVAWRFSIVRRADPPAPDRDAGTMAAPKSSTRLGVVRPDRDAEVRAVAAEMRAYVGEARGCDEILRWADRLDPKPAPEPPEPLKAGADARDKSGLRGRVEWLGEGRALMRWPGGNYTLTMVDMLERIA